LAVGVPTSEVLRELPPVEPAPRPALDDEPAARIGADPVFESSLEARLVCFFAGFLVEGLALARAGAFFARVDFLVAGLFLARALFLAPLLFLDVLFFARVALCDLRLPDGLACEALRFLAAVLGALVFFVVPRFLVVRLMSALRSGDLNARGFSSRLVLSCTLQNS